MEGNNGNRRRLDWNHLASLATILAVIMIYPIYFNSKIDSIQNRMDSMQQNLSNKIEMLAKDVRDEMRDFHGRLERHDCMLEMLMKKQEK